MTIYAPHFREIVQDTLRRLESQIPYSEEAVELLMLTAAQESQLGTYLAQIPIGPALGVYQMEPATHEDVWKNFISFRPNLADLLASFAVTCSSNRLPGNLYYATAIARVHYFRVKEALPSLIEGGSHHLSLYWKRYWNTPEGKGHPDQAQRAYEMLC